MNNLSLKNIHLKIKRDLKIVTFSSPNSLIPFVFAVIGQNEILKSFITTSSIYFDVVVIMPLNPSMDSIKRLNLKAFGTCWVCIHIYLYPHRHFANVLVLRMQTVSATGRAITRGPEIGSGGRSCC